MTKKVKNKDEPVKKRGAPFKPKDKQVDDVYHLYVWQVKRMEEEAGIRNKSTAAMIRDGIDWFITALDTARSDVSASKLFDDKFKEEVLSVDDGK